MWPAMSRGIDDGDDEDDFVSGYYVLHALLVEIGRHGDHECVCECGRMKRRENEWLWLDAPEGFCIFWIEKVCESFGSKRFPYLLVSNRFSDLDLGSKRFSYLSDPKWFPAKYLLPPYLAHTWRSFVESSR
jgi:hypothetical protein